MKTKKIKQNPVLLPNKIKQKSFRDGGQDPGDITYK
jgi:hypothetical protein